VTAPKMLVSHPPSSPAIDMLAGPTELLIIADEQARARWVAADLISQAEHGEDSQVVLVSTSRGLVERVQSEVVRQLSQLPRRQLAKRSLSRSFSLVVNTIEDAIEFSNRYAPEHLMLAVDDADASRKRITS